MSYEENTYNKRQLIIFVYIIFIIISRFLKGVTKLKENFIMTKLNK